MRIFGFTIIRTKALDLLEKKLIEASKNDFRHPVTKQFVTKEYFLEHFVKRK